MKLFLKWVISLLIAAVFIWLSFRQWPVADLMCDDVSLESGSLYCHSIANSLNWVINLFWLLPAVLVLTAVHFLRVLRWAPLLRPLARLDFWTLNRVGAVSFMAVFVFPLRLGEFARPYFTAQTGRIRKSAVFGTIAVERVMDGLMMALVLALVLFLLPSSDEATYLSLRAGAVVALLVFSSALVLLVVAYVSKAYAVRFVHLVFGLVSQKLAQRLAGIMEAFIDGMRGMPSARHFLSFVLLTGAYWAVNGLFYYCLAAAFGLADTVGLTGAYAMMSAVAVGMMIPNSPANVGSFWYFLLLPVALFGISTNPGTPMAFALCVWGMMLLQYVVFAGYFFARGKVSLKTIWTAQKDQMTNGP